MNDLIKSLTELNPKALIADGYDKAIKGIGNRNGKPVLIYSSNKCIKQLMEDNNWSEEDALEWFTYNTESAYVGDNTPIFEWDIDCTDSINNNYIG